MARDRGDGWKEYLRSSDSCMMTVESIMSSAGLGSLLFRTTCARIRSEATER